MVVSGVSVQMTEDRKQKSDRVFHFPVCGICHLTTVFCILASDT